MGLIGLKSPNLIPPVFAVRSEHSIILSPGAASCARCHLGINGPPALLKAWMGTSCPSPLTQVLGADTLTRPRPLSSASPTWLGGVVLHASHRLYSYRGFVSAMSVDLLLQRPPRNSSYLVGRIYLSALHLKELVISIAFGKVYCLTACLGGLRIDLIPAHSVLDLCQLTKPLRLPPLTYFISQF